MSGQFINPFTPPDKKGRQSRPHGFLDDAAQEQARSRLNEIRERWTELYPRPNSRQRDELKRLYQQKIMNLPPYTQIIQPWQFGHDYSKKTCLWLKNLPPLQPTEIVELTYYTTPKGRRFTRGWYFTPRNGKDRSRTFPGIAAAMADQWGNLQEIQG